MDANKQIKAVADAYLQMKLDEVYRLTPKRRAVLDRADSAAMDQMDIHLDAPGGHEAYNMSMLGGAHMTRTELMRAMALPQDKRSGAWAGSGVGADDEKLKTAMINARRTQKTIENLIKRNNRLRKDKGK